MHVLHGGVLQREYMKTKKLRSDLNWSEFVALAVHVELRFSAPPMCLFSYAMVVTRWYLLHFRLRRGVLQDLVEKRRCGTHVPTHSTLLTLCTPTCSISVEEILLPLSILSTTSQGISHWSNFCSGIWRRFRRLNLAESKTEHS